MHQLTIKGKSYPFSPGMKAMTTYLLKNGQSIRLTNMSEGFTNLSLDKVPEVILTAIEVGCMCAGVAFDLTSEDIMQAHMRDDIDIMSLIHEFSADIPDAKELGKQTGAKQTAP